MPLVPDPSPWNFPTPEDFDPDDDLVAIGADLEPGTIVNAYAAGLFPMPHDAPDEPDGEPALLWFSPMRRGVLPLSELRVSRSLRRSCRDFEIRVDTAFEDVIDGCADLSRPQGWIDSGVRSAYVRLHEMGWAHSVEAWRDGELAGGLYGVALGGLFAGESMFHRVRDASKVALVGLVELMSQGGHVDERLLDTQWSTSHLASLGVTEIGREQYLARLQVALRLPFPPAFDR